MFDWIWKTKAEQQGSAEQIIRSIQAQYESDSGVAVNADIAMRFSTVYSCVRLLSDTIAQMPCRIFDRQGEDSNPDIQNPLYNLLSISPENGITAFTFWKKYTEKLFYKGFSVARVIKNPDNEPVRLILIPKIAKIERDSLGKYSFTYYANDNSLAVLSQDDAFFSFWALDDNMLPLSPIEVNRNAIGLAIAAEKHGCKVFKSGGNPSGVLEYPNKLDKQLKESIRDSWNSTYGTSGVGGVAILEGGTKYAKVQMSNEDAQYLETRQFQKQDICGIFGVPVHMVSDTSQAKGWSTMEQMMIEFITMTINPISIRLEQDIKKCLIPFSKWQFKYAKFMTQGLLRGDTAARTAYYATGIDKGYLLKNEARKLEDLNPIKGLDDKPKAENTAI